jgi:hypothetical protein
MMKLLAALQFLMASTVFCACSGDSQTSQGESPPEGVTRIIHVDSLREMRLVEELKLGSALDPNVGFSRVVDVEISDAGLVFVMDDQDRRIKVYDPEGVPIRTIGGPGGGPGEFGVMREFGLLGDTLWVSDSRNQRITLFSLTGELLTTVPTRGVEVAAIDAPGLLATIVPLRPRRDGFYSSNVRFSAGDDPVVPDSFLVPDLVFAADGEVVDTAGFHVVHPRQRSGNSVYRSGAALSFTNPLNDDPLGAAVGSDTVVILRAASDDSSAAFVSVRRLGPAGQVEFETILEHEPMFVPQSFRDSTVNAAVGPFERMVIQARGSQSQAEQIRAAVDSLLSGVSHFPLVDRHHVGEDGIVWLRTRPGNRTQFRWVVLSGQGSPLGYVDLPESSSVVRAEGEEVWITELDAVGVPWLVRYQLSVP